MSRHLIYHTAVCFDKNSDRYVTASIKHINAMETNANIKSISKQGLTLNCDMRALQEILPNGNTVSPKQPAKTEVSFYLGEIITCQCNVIYVRRTAKDCFSLELRFDAINDKDQALIDRYVDQRFINNGQPTKDKAANCSKQELSNVA